MAFSEFTNAEATMKKISTNGAGDPTVDDSFTVNIDPDFGYRRVFTQDNEEISGRSTVIGYHASIDLTHRNWKLNYNGKDWQVEELNPSNRIGTTTPSHYEAVLR